MFRSFWLTNQIPNDLNSGQHTCQVQLPGRGQEAGWQGLVWGNQLEDQFLKTFNFNPWEGECQEDSCSLQVVSCWPWAFARVCESRDSKWPLPTGLPN